MWWVLPHGSGKLKLCISAETLLYFHFHRNSAFSSKHPKLVCFFFPFHMDAPSILSPPRLQLPRAHKRDTHTRQTQREKMKSFNRRGRQELLTYALISMYILGLLKVLDYTSTVLLLLYKYTPIWWKILGHIQLHNSIYCCFEYVFTYVSAKKGCSEENKSHISRL